MIDFEKLGTFYLGRSRAAMTGTNGGADASARGSADTSARGSADASARGSADARARGSAVTDAVAGASTGASVGARAGASTGARPGAGTGTSGAASGVASPEAGELFLYDSKDLTTHAVIIGMTGSGKTGLGIGLLEEALIDGIPVLAIDPKGDIGNLLLSFPDLAPADFRPWVNADEAAQQGLDPDAFAAAEAAKWSTGLAGWGQDGARIRRLRDAAEFAIYTPGASSGRSLSLLKSFDPPPESVRTDAGALRERVQTTVAGLLGLLGIESDPLRGRESILLATILGQLWSAGRGADLPGLVAAVQEPPFTKVGVMALDSFYPERERFELALALNGLLASPGFAAWTEGEPLDVRNLLYTSAGKARASIFSIAHLGDAERMFFVALLLNEVLAWMRAQPGTSSLRAVLYMDEIFGYFPPSANPPTKQPLLTLLKQARAFGLGVVLATQNPVDLDYKGLANAGTWFIGRLQTERDKARVLEALEGVLAGGGALPHDRLDETLSSLPKRVFLCHNVHEGAPALFETRWTLSYLRGPLTLQQAARLSPGVPAPAAVAPPPSAATVATTATATTASTSSAPATASATSVTAARPILPPAVPQVFLPVAEIQGAGAGMGTGWGTGASAGTTFAPRLLLAAQVRYTAPRLGIDTVDEVVLLAPLPEGVAPLDLRAAAPATVGLAALSETAPAGARFVEPPAGAADPKTYPRWSKEFTRWIAAERPLPLLAAPALGLVSRPGEDEGAFRVRVDQSAREQRDAAVETLRAKYAPKVVALQERLVRAQGRVQEQAAQAQARSFESAISVGTGLLGALLGRRGGIAGRAGTAARSAARAYKEKQDVARATEGVAAVQAQLAALDAEFQRELQALRGVPPPAIEPTSVKAKQADVAVRLVALAWVPERR